MSGDTVVGSLKKATGGTLRDRRAWSITCILIDPGESPRIDWAPTRQEAQQQLAEAWRAWLVRMSSKKSSRYPGGKVVWTGRCDCPSRCSKI
jgi:hypothetical protein